MINDQDPTYKSIQIEDITQPIKFPFDIFVRIKADENNYKHIKRFKNNSSIDKVDIENLVNNGIKSVYCKSTELESYKSDVAARKANLYKLLASAQKGHKKSLNDLRSGNITEATKELVMESIDELVVISNEYEQLNSFLNRLLDMHGATLFQHTNITAILTCEMLNQDSLIEKGLKKDIIAAAFLHNLTISDNYDYMSINTAEELELHSLDLKIKQRILTHAFDSYNICKNLDFISSTTLELIRCHHGSVSGKGFSDELPPNLSVLARTFIVAERFTSNLLEDFYKSNSNIHIKALVDDLFTVFTDRKTTVSIKLLKDVFVNEAKLLKRGTISLINSL